jgi:L-threonylcarbamoyladenylate synthase
MKFEEIIQQTLEVLRRGGTILYPTDTIWGIGCDARNANAVERIYNIKERDHTKSMLVLAENSIWKDVDGERPTTYILPRSLWLDKMQLEIAPNLPADDGSLGVRIPQHRFCKEILHRLGAPIVSTSANLSGHPSPTRYENIEKALIERIDYCVPPLAEFLSNESRGSRIVKIESDGSETIIRP